MKKRNIALAIIFTIITCGIYGIYWYIVMTDDANRLTPGTSYQTSGGVAFLLTLVTCGIYSLSWNSQMGKKVDQMNNGGSNAVVYLMLAIFGFSIMNWGLLQNEINKRVA